MDCGKTDRVVVELLSGHAEIFGTEMVAHNKYQVTIMIFKVSRDQSPSQSSIQSNFPQFQRGAKFAVFTFQGCRVQVRLIIVFTIDW